MSRKKLYRKKWHKVHSAKLDTEHYVQPKSEVKQKGSGKLGRSIKKAERKKTRKPKVYHNSRAGWTRIWQIVEKHSSGKWRRKENTKSSPKGQVEQGEELSPKLKVRFKMQQCFRPEGAMRRETVTAMEKLCLFLGSW